MNKEKIQSILEQKFGHRKLLIIGLVLLILVNSTFPLMKRAGDLVILLDVLDLILLFISISAILFARSIKHKSEEQ